MMALLLLLCLDTTSLADVIVSPGTVIRNTLGNFSGRDVNVVVNQVGLSDTYDSAITEFDTFVASTSHAVTGLAGDFWFASTDTGDIDFDLGTPFAITKLALWNNVLDQLGAIRGFDVFGSNLSDFGDSVNLGSFSASPTDNPAVFDLVDSTVQFVRITVNSNFQNASFT